jgi:quinoprotein glucose dehydrogenase
LSQIARYTALVLLLFRSAQSQEQDRFPVAWTFHAGDMYAGSKGGLRGKASAFETTPVYADGALYITTAFGRVIALDPDAGTQKWAFDPHVDTYVGYGDFANRGVATWRDAKTGRRTIFIATIDARLFALDAATSNRVCGCP